MCGLGHLPQPELPWVPLHPCLHLRWLREGLTYSLAILPAGPRRCCSVNAQQGAWGILVSDLGVCGVLAGSPAVWASWAAGSFSQGSRARPSRVMKATLSGPAQAGEGARWGTGGPQVTAQGLTLPVAHSGPCPCPEHIQPLLSLLGLEMGHTGARILEGRSGGESTENG